MEEDAEQEDLTMQRVSKDAEKEAKVNAKVVKD